MPAHLDYNDEYYYARGGYDTESAIVCHTQEEVAEAKLKLMEALLEYDIDHDETDVKNLIRVKTISVGA